MTKKNTDKENTLKGNPGKRKPQKDIYVPSYKRTPQPPSYLKFKAREAWKQYAPLVHNMGRLTKVDLHGFAALCSLMGKVEEALEAMGKEGNKDDPLAGCIAPGKNGLRHNIHYSIWRQCLEELRRWLPLYYMTPQSRAGKGGNKDKEEKKNDIHAEMEEKLKLLQGGGK